MDNKPSSSDQRQDQNHFNQLRRGFKCKFAHPLGNLLTKVNIGIRTRSFLRKFYAFFSLVSHIEPKHYAKVLEDLNQTLIMQDELN